MPKNSLTNLSDLIRLRLRTGPLKVDQLRHALSPEHMVAPPDAFGKPELQEVRAQIVKSDACVGSPAQDPLAHPATRSHCRNVGPVSSAHETDFGDGTQGTWAMNQRCLRSTHSKMPSLAVASDGTGADAATGPKS